ncbi:uncharacterized protein LOC127875011 [Dreissena polymorpha]|uniref:uncharacterized protein LOC127875011 n=2 Tax=Dreissena polymorpha TaxID=45954 RepID=UPI0022642067|nr:uncharacterized protein LOC127875011 [Dreissena polymorpha]
MQLNINFVRDIREKFWHNPKLTRITLLKASYEKSEKVGKYRYFSVQSKKQEVQLCTKAFLAALRVNKNTLTTVADMCMNNKEAPTGKSPRNWDKSTLLLIAWLEDYFRFHGERMPHRNEIVMPYGTVKSYIYEQYKMDVENPVSKSQFYKKWIDSFQFVKTKKTNSFSKCTTCVTLERLMSKTTSFEMRAFYKKKKEEHNIRQMLERKYYYNKKDQAQRNPSQHMSIIIDGMDQAKTNLPHFAGRNPKNLHAVDLLHTHVTGVLSHGHGGFHAYVDINEYPHDPNLTINIILKELLRQARANNNFLPPNLFIQADNCWRENKNRYVFAFLELLVAEQVFHEVHMSFLIVGHTHEDIDAKFSEVSRLLNTKDAEYFDDFLNVLKNAER